jgi:hypothetical protein
MKLKLQGEHQDDKYPEVGEVSSIFWNKERTVFAVVSEYCPLPSAIRPRFNSKYGQRISLYVASSRSLVSSFSGTSYEIFHVAFHPDLPVLLASTASYDGGFYFQGELIEWNWQTNERRWLATGPAFYASRFASSSEIEVLVTPIDEEDINSGQDAFKIFRYKKLRIDEIPLDGVPTEWLQPPSSRDVHPEELGFTALPIFSEHRKTDRKASKEEVHSLLACRNLRGVVRDIVSSKSQLIVIKDRLTLEYRDSAGKILDYVESEFTGSQICSIGEDSFLVSTHSPTLPLYTSKEQRGRISKWSLGATRLEKLIEGANPFVLSQGRDGTVLARSCSLYSDNVDDRFRQPIGVNYLIGLDLKSSPLAPLGSYSPSFNYIATRYSEHLYFLGPEARAAGLRIGTINREKCVGELLDFFDKRPDAEFLAKSHSYLQPELFAAHRTQKGEDLIGSGTITVFPGRWLVWRHDLAATSWTWKRLFDQRVHLLLSIASHNAVLVGLDGGTIELLNAETGETLDQKQLSFAGIPSLPMEACLLDGQCVIATLEGRFLFFGIE